jgi:hypothetical protein
MQRRVASKQRIIAEDRVSLIYDNSPMGIGYQLGVTVRHETELTGSRLESLPGTGAGTERSHRIHRTGRGDD